MPSSPYPIAPIGGTVPLNQIPDLETYLNVSGYTLGPTVLGQWNAANGISSSQSTPFSGILGDQSGTYLGDALTGLGKFFDPFGTGKSPAANAADSTKKTISGWLGLPTIGQAIAVVIGIVFIAGGLFLLSKGPAVNVIASGVKKVATGA